MSRLTIPEPNITIYEDGFTGHDQLERSQTGKALSELVERISDPMVIALDGGWGSGKSHFLKCWVGQHLKQEGNTTQTVYFDAFKHDFIDEPLISLMGVIEDRFREVEDKTWKDRFAPVVTVAKKLVKPALRISAAAGTGMASEVAIAALGTEKIDTMMDGAVDTAARGIGAEATKTIDQLWESEAGRRQAMEEFRDTLIALTAPLDAETPKTGEESAPPAPKHKKLVIVVDELDRCRPDYALSLLEIIKHFFDVPHVHFVLGVNLGELENSVKARYGAGINAGLYLQKFVTVTMRLPKHQVKGKTQLSHYLRHCASEIGIHEGVTNDAAIVVDCYRNKTNLSLRDMERFITVLALIPNSNTPLHKQYQAFRLVTVTLALMKAIDNEKYYSFTNNDFPFSDIKSLFVLSADSAAYAPHENMMLNRAWSLFLSPDTVKNESGWREFEPTFSMPDPKEALSKQIETYLETFKIFEGAPA
ncbi:MAG: P-loop NTPase fold protein [Sulfitobacter sp.]